MRLPPDKWKLMLLCAVVLSLQSAAQVLPDTTLHLSRGLSMRFVQVPSGSFLQGSMQGDPDERPLQKVVISKPFYIACYEVTQADWMAIMDSNLATFQLMPYALHRAMESVSWQDCMQYIDKLNALGMGFFRLPTEAEWEYACRAGSTTAYYWGDSMEVNGTSEYTWANSKSGTAPQPPGGKRPNAWGLYDMSGNVWEWCSDWYAPYTAAIQYDPKGPASGTEKVFRGGSWYDFYQAHRSANRHRHQPDGRYAAIGFRLVWQPYSPEKK